MTDPRRAGPWGDEDKVVVRRSGLLLASLPHDGKEWRRETEEQKLLLLRVLERQNDAGQTLCMNVCCIIEGTYIHTRQARSNTIGNRRLTDE
eukprot:scaffold306507_cov47-Prasinocladus_malaysianus.AAC.2